MLFGRRDLWRRERKVSQRIVLSANGFWNILNFRAGLVRALVENGLEVHIIAADDGFAARVSELGAIVHPIHLKSSSMRPTDDVQTLVAYLRLLRKLQPIAFLGFTIKPNIYGGLASRCLGIRSINNISGLGNAFAAPGKLQSAVAALYRVALAKSHKVFFQNADDRTLFEDRGLNPRGKTSVLPGSGIDLYRFLPVDRTFRSEPIVFLLIARMLYDKGILEFVAAAKRVSISRPNVASFNLLGPVGVDNKAAIDPETLKQWVADGAVNYLGAVDDVRDSIAGADCVVLPSYREGVPRSLIEAAAMATPVIASDAPGCRDIVDDGETGYLCEVRSTESLTQAIERMIDVGPERRVILGHAGRGKVEREFDERIVIDAYLAAIYE